MEGRGDMLLYRPSEAIITLRDPGPGSDSHITIDGISFLLTQAQRDTLAKERKRIVRPSGNPAYLTVSLCLEVHLIFPVESSRKPEIISVHMFAQKDTLK